ncbi:reverse transcriptase [Phytophthora megakarya]|uniref:Reverse transcriptase n=1 Tax=Phytophthora megakarya TaxID=4795 RepID=A0A225WIK7_9STRA|nr:reverse transcriptase [Phytophthora megakarya]
MASGFWVEKMTDRARLISAFITPFGIFEWNRMPFGLKNAPQLYQRMIDNVLYGFTRILKSEGYGSTLDVFEDGEPVGPGKPSMLGRRSYIDDILVSANNWDQLCDRVGVYSKCVMSGIRRSSFWGIPKVEYLGHKVSHNSLEANPKVLSVLTDLAFPGSLRAIQSFLGSLNYYSRFIEDYVVYASVEYVDQGSQEDQAIDHQNTLDLEAQDLTEVNPRWIHAYRSFRVLKSKITTTPILRHFDPDRRATVVVYGSDWTVSGSLMQEYDKVYCPVMFASRTLTSKELNYGISEKDVLALLRILDLNYNALVGRLIRVLTRHSTLVWLFRSTALLWRLGQWLSPWTLEITKCVKGEDEILGALAANITPSSKVDNALISIVPKKEAKRKLQAPIPTIGRDEDLYVVSFDVSARVKGGGGAYRAILWELPEWRIWIRRRFDNERGGIPWIVAMLENLDPRRLVICGDSNLVIRQVRSEIDCNGPDLTLLRQRALDRLYTWPDHELFHDKGDWNGIWKEIQDLVTLNRLVEILAVKTEDEIAQISAVTTFSKARFGVRMGSDPGSLREKLGRELRIERTWQAQDEESWIAGLKKYLVGKIPDLIQEKAKVFGSFTTNYEVDQSDLLFYHPTTKEATADRDKLMQLVVPETLQQDIFHHYHTSLQGGHQGIGRPYDWIRDPSHWRGLYKRVQRYVGECVDCETGKGRSRIPGESPGNLQATYPFQIIAMDHIPSLPRSWNGNTELLIFVHLFSGYVIAKANASRSAQTIAETYEECVFRRFGASEVTWHDQEPGFMSDFFKSFIKILDQRQRATMAYRPQANGSAERRVQTTTRALKMIWINVMGMNMPNGYLRDQHRKGPDPGGDPDGEHSQARPRSKKVAISDAKYAHILWSLDQDFGCTWIESREKYAKKLAYLWHGPFRVAEKMGEYAVRSRFATMVRVSKFKTVRIFPDLPAARLEESSADRVDFDYAVGFKIETPMNMK